MEKISWLEKDKLASIKLNEMRSNATKNSILFEVSSKILRALIIEGIDIGIELAKQKRITQLENLLTVGYGKTNKPLSKSRIKKLEDELNQLK